MKSLFSLSIALFTTAITTFVTSILPATAGDVISRVYQLQLVARPNGQGPYCIDIDVSKIGVNPGANNAKVSPCRNIREQRFIITDSSQGAGYGFNQFMLEAKSYSLSYANQSQCLATNGTKVGLIAGAENTYTEPCRNIQEINHSLLNFGNGNHGLLLQARAANGAQLCQAVNGTKIGIIQGAEQVRTEPCRNIQEMQWKLVEVERTEVAYVTPLYDYWIVSRKPEGLLSTTNVGHAFTAIIRKNQKVYQTFSGNTLIAQSAVQDHGNWFPWHTYGYWPQAGTALSGPGYLRVDNDNNCNSNTRNNECQDVRDILAGRSISSGGFAVRKVRVSENRAVWINANKYNSMCSYYRVYGEYNSVLQGCNCSTYATLQWYNFLSQRANENFIPLYDQTNLLISAPHYITNWINNRNQTSGSDFVDNGAIWN